MKRKILYFGTALIAIIAFNSCDLEDIAKLVNLADIEEAAPTVEENIEVQAKIIDVFENVNNLIGGSDLKSSSLYGDNPVVTVDGNTYTFDFTNVTNSSGTIVVEFSGTASFTTLNLSAVITFNNYFSDNCMIDGSMDMTVSPTISGTIDYTLISADYLTIELYGEEFDWSCNYTLKWTHGITTPGNSTDDVFLMSGLSIQLKDGRKNKMEIIEDVVISNDCEYIKQGVIDAEIYNDENLIELTIDFGVDADGINSNECDSSITISSGSLKLPISL